MPLTANQRRDILAYLEDEAEIAGEEVGLEFILDRWDEVTDLATRENQSLRRELRQLRDQRPIARDNLNAIIARIAEINATLNP